MTDDDYRDLIERAHQLRELTQHPGWQVLTGHVHAYADRQNRWLLSGKAKTVEEYRGKAGWLSGVQYVLELPDLLTAKVEHEARARKEAEQDA